MTKTLVIVESPAKAKTINKYLGTDYIVRASFGHVRDLPVKELGVDLDNDFEPTYVVNDDKVKTVKELRKLAKECSTVLIASDPDREGEAIAWHLENLLKKDCKDIHRIVFNEITKPAILKAVQKPSNVDVDMVNSQQARRILDRVVGYQLSPWLGSVMQSKLSAGRVQSVALRVIVDREREIENFKPEEYWKVYAQLTPETEKFPFSSELVKKENKAIKFTNKAEVDSALEDLKGATYIVKSVEKKERAKKPAAPFTTSTLQQEAVRKLKWDSSRAMKTAQTLYEGVELSDGSHGLITYMRTDSTRISEDFQKVTATYIDGKWGNEYKPTKFNVYKTKGDAQDAHEAVRPTDVSRDPESIKQYLTDDLYKLYKLIWERYVASQMAPAVYDTMTVLIDADKYEFKSSGSSMKFNGFMVLYEEDKDVEENNESENDDSDILLPQLKERDQVEFIKIDTKQKFTSPPSRFTEATLIKELEAKGVGRPSTYASIISTIQNRGYVQVSKTRFDSTQLGRQVIDLLVGSFPDVMDIQFTARMEDNLDSVAEGKAEWVSVLYDFYNPFSEALTKAKADIKPIVKESQLAGEDCPTCGKPLIIKEGKTGKFISCSGYPDCTFIKNYVDEKHKTDIKCEKCGHDMIIKEIKKDRKKEKFLGCSNYPTCRNTKPLDKKGKVIEKAAPQESDKACPKCNKKMLIREGTSGKFLACSGYPDCKHTEPYIDETTPTIKCDSCGEDMVLKKGQYGHFYSCTGFPECNNKVKADAKGKVIVKKPEEDTGKACPNCGKPMALRVSGKNKFYGCTGFPTCKTSLPFGETKECPKCGKHMIKRKGAKGDFWGCSGYPTCNHLENIK